MWDSLLKLVFVNKRLLSTLFFLSVSYLVYSQSIEKKSQLLEDLQSKKTRLLSEKTTLVERQNVLALELSSSSDPAWIELSLMRRLGVVPEGQVKVHFSSDP